MIRANLAILRNRFQHWCDKMFHFLDQFEQFLLKLHQVIALQSLDRPKSVVHLRLHVHQCFRLHRDHRAHVLQECNVQINS